ncbi:DUF2637 domain-containing protein [Streptomyces sp. NPDC008343]|uniref:DUF2637 domain-containing protein n=1 Tax=Streptomyces sp. NPDC008343 TaxID=3364828 RepID=UPI0036E91DB3
MANMTPVAPGGVAAAPGGVDGDAEGGRSGARGVFGWRSERTAEEKAARQAKRVTLTGYALLLVVVGIAAAMSWNGLVGFGTDVLHLKAPWAYGVPVSLDVAAMLCGFLSLRAVIAHDSAAGPRLLTFFLVVGSAGANYYNADTEPGGSTAAALYFGAMSVLSWWLFDVVLRQIRRTMLRRIGAVERPLARFRIVRWLRYPRETFEAWSLSVRYGLTRPEDALARVWQAQQVKEVEDLNGLPEGITKADAVRLALSAKEGDVPAALEWLKDRGMTVDRSYAYDIAKKTPRVDPAPVPPQLPATGAHSAPTP